MDIYVCVGCIYLMKLYVMLTPLPLLTGTFIYSDDYYVFYTQPKNMCAVIQICFICFWI